MITTDKSKIFMENVDILCSMNEYNVINIEKMLGLSAGYISRCRSGQRHMSLDVACEIADFLEQPIDVMIDDTLPIKTQIDLAQKEITRLRRTIGKLQNKLDDKTRPKMSSSEISDRQKLNEQRIKNKEVNKK